MIEIVLPNWLVSILTGVNILAIGYLGILNLTYLVMTIIAVRSLTRYILQLQAVHFDGFLRSEASPPVTLVAPAYNEEATCVESVRALLGLEYPEFDVIVVNDGSKDGTLARLIEAFDLSPSPRFPMAGLRTAEVREVYRSARHFNLWVIDKANGGKADALNTGLNYCRTPLFCAMDADSMLERDALLRLTRAFIEEADMVAAGGIIRIANGCLVKDGEIREVRLPRNLVAGFQVMEYLRAFLVGRVGWAAINSTLVISGAFGVFRRSAVVEAGGFDRTTVGEDMELVVRLHRHFREKGEPYRIGFVPDPVAWTEAPESLEQLGRQRDRWQRGLVETMTRNLPMLFNPRYGRIGLIAFPYFFFLEMIGPVIEMAGYLSFVFLVANGSISVPHMIAFLSLAIVFGLTLSLTAVLMEEMTFRRYPRKRDLLHLFTLAIVENFGYRQLNFYWRFKGTFSKLWKAKGWGEMKRKGFQTVKPGG